MLVRCKKEGNSLRAMSHKWKRDSRRGDIGEQGCVKVGTRMELSVIQTAADQDEISSGGLGDWSAGEG